MGSFDTSPLNTEPGSRAPLETARPARSTPVESASLVPGPDRFHAQSHGPGRAVALGLEAFAMETPTRWAALLDTAGILLDRGSRDLDPSSQDLLG